MGVFKVLRCWGVDEPSRMRTTTNYPTITVTEHPTVTSFFDSSYTFVFDTSPTTL